MPQVTLIKGTKIYDKVHLLSGKCPTLMLSQGLLGSMFETGWDNLAPRAATTEWRGEGTYMALIVPVRFD